MSSTPSIVRIGAEYCSGISPPTFSDYCLHMAMFYRHRTHPHPIHPPNRQIPNHDHLTNPPSAIDSLEQLSSPIPVAPGLCPIPLETRTPRMSHYPVFRLTYEDHLPTGLDYKLFILTETSGPIRGLYLHITNSPTEDAIFTETPGDIPERQLFASPQRRAVLLSSTPIGAITVEDYDRFWDLCRHVPPPGNHAHGTRRRSREWAQDIIGKAIEMGVLDVGV